MVRVGDRAPDFTVPKAGGTAYYDIDPFTLGDEVGDGPIVLAFYPAAFTRGCTAEMFAFRDALPDFEALNARVFGVSVDLPFAQNVWIDEQGFTFAMLSDWTHTVIRQYDVILEGLYDMLETAERNVFVIDSDGVVTYRWMCDNNNPDFEDLVEQTHRAVATAE